MGQPGRHCRRHSTPTAYHYAEVTGLQPDTPYFYVAMSNGQTAQQTSMQFPVGVGGCRATRS